MSKMMDVLENTPAKKQHSAHHIEMQDEIAKTYFHTHIKKGGRKKPKWKAALPWVVASGALVLALAIVIFRSSFDVKIRFLGEIPTVSLGSAGNANREDPDKGIFLVMGGEPNRDIVKRVSFNGDAKSFSMSKPEELILCNTRSAGWANYTVELREPVDLNKLDIKYTAKGLKGGENLVLVIGDSDNRVYRLEKDISSELNNDWQRHTISFGRVKKAVDLSNIALIKFEFGSLTAGNNPNAGLFLKDIRITKTRRLKWL